jgi:hypothetical protein
MKKHGAECGQCIHYEAPPTPPPGFVSAGKCTYVVVIWPSIPMTYKGELPIKVDGVWDDQNAEGCQCYEERAETRGHTK